MLAIKADTSSEDGGGNLESDDLISGAELEGYVRDGGSSDHEEEDLEEGAELHEYARSLGLDPHVDRDLLWVAKEAFTAPLPAGWTDHVDSEGRLYFCNQVTQESSWFHPTDLVFQEIIELVKALRLEQPPPTEARRSAALHDHLVLAHRDAQAGLDGWSGPYDSEQGPYYYNRTLDVSTWENPVDEREWELATRQRTLRRCLFSEWPGPGEARGEEAAAAPPGSGPAARDATLGLASPSAHVQKPRSPSSARSFRTAYSARSVRSGRSATPSRPLSRSSRLPSQSPPVSPACAGARSSSALAARRPEASSLRPLLRPVPPPSGGPEAEPPGAGGAAPPPAQPPRSSEPSPARSPGRRLAQRQPGSPARPRAPPRAASPAPAPAPAGAPGGPAAPSREAPRAAAPRSEGRGAGREAGGGAELEGAAAPSSSSAAEASAAAGGGAAARPRQAAAAAGGAQEFDLVAAISEFVEDASRNSLELPLGLSADQRKRAKALVEQHSGFKCESYGFGAERRIHIFRESSAPKDKHELPSRVVEEEHAENVEFTFGPTDNLEIPKVGD